MKKDFIINWFSEKSTMPRKELEENLDINYLEEGLIDSFGFLELIASCERELDVVLSDKDFENDAIFTISGLIAILEQAQR